MKKRLLAGPVPALFPFSYAVYADTSTQLMSETVVTATRTEAQVDAVAGTVTSITAEEVARQAVVDEQDLFADEADMAFARDARRFGATRPNIRGLEDNRVMQLVDGVRVPDYYNGGGPTNYTMNPPLGLATEFIRQVEVVRGTASSLYGSDALGGVVGYVSIEPGDFVEAGAAFGGRARIGYTGADEGVSASIIGAGRNNEGVEWLIGYVYKDAQETANMGDDSSTSDTRTAPNPMSGQEQGLLAKLTVRPAAGHTLKFTVEGRDQDSTVEVKRLSSTLPNVVAMSGSDHGERLRASLEWQHRADAGWYDRMTARLYHQTNDTVNYNTQRREDTSASCSASFPGVNTCIVEQQFQFQQNLLGGGLQIEKAVGNHFVSGGLDLSRADTEQLTNATVYNLTTNTVSNSLAGDTYPTRSFAPGYTETVGLFVQDEISLAAESVRITPGLRYDWRRLEAEPDVLSEATLTAIGKQAASQTNGKLSPKLAGLWKFSSTWSAYGHVAAGFRAPNYEEVNGHFINTLQSYGISPNPDLKPETSVGMELGLRHVSQSVRAQLSVYDNQYENFIERVELDCPTDPNCISGVARTYMNDNVSNAHIYGAEIRAAWDMAPGWTLAGSYAHTVGDNEETNQPLNTIEPERMTLSLARTAGNWGALARIRAASKKSRVDDTDGSGGTDEWFRTPAYGVLDLSTWWSPSKNTRLTLAVNNVLDKKYWLWSDIRQADARNPDGVDFYSQPGRNVSASFEYRF